METEVGWPRAETDRNQVCKRRHELDTGRREQIEGTAQKTLCLAFAEDLQSTGVTWTGAKRVTRDGGISSPDVLTRMG